MPAVPVVKDLNMFGKKMKLLTVNNKGYGRSDMYGITMYDCSSCNLRRATYIYTIYISGISVLIKKCAGTVPIITFIYIS